ncbi:MAG: dnaB [Frankiales bacterium]|nr:dnaB [Frankiales bacterium]
MSLPVLPPWPTGTTNLDQMTGGGAPGEVWVVSGPPRVGASRLALGIARAVARHAGQPVRWLSMYEEPEVVRDRVLLAEGGFLISHVKPGLNASEELIQMLPAVEAEVARLPLSIGIRVEGEPLGVACRDGAEGVRGLLVVDQVPVRHAREALAELGTIAHASRAWVVVVVLADEGRGLRAVRSATTQHSDLLVWVERPDLDDPTTDRCGEADLFVYRRGRRVQSEYVAYQERYERFINVMTHPWYGGTDPH